MTYPTSGGVQPPFCSMEKGISLKNNRYVIGRGVSVYGAPERCGIDYVEGAQKPILVWDIAPEGPAGVGAQVSPSQALAYKRDFARSNADWFWPLLERMAKGESVTLDQISAVHEELFGRPLQVATD